MDRDTVIRLAHKAEGEPQPHGMWRMHVEDLERFADLVVAQEREACAEVCDLLQSKRDDDEDYNQACYDCADFIRSRK